MYKSQKVGNRIVDYTSIGKGEPLIFPSGFNISPKQLIPFFKKIDITKYNIISPNIASMHDKLETLVECAEFVTDFCSSIKMGDEYKGVGYSMGGSILFRMCDNNSNTPKKIVCINPVVPTDYKFWGYILRSVNLTVKELCRDGLKNIAWKTDISKNFINNFTSQPIKNLRLVNDFGRFKSDFYVNQPTLILLGTEDEYFKPKYFNDDFKDCFKDLDIKLIHGCSHTITRKYVKEVAQYATNHLED